MAYTARFDDVFTEASDTALASHTPTGAGDSWTEIGDVGGNATVDSATDTVDHPFGGGSGIIAGYTADFSGTWADDHEAESTGMHNGTVALGNGTRIQSDGGTQVDGYRVRYNGGSNQYELHRIDSGAITVLGTYAQVSPSDAHVILVRSEGDTHSMQEDTVEKISVSDATFGSGGSPGVMTVRSYDGQGIDDFVARDQAAAGGGTELLQIPHHQRGGSNPMHGGFSA